MDVNRKTMEIDVHKCQSVNRTMVEKCTGRYNCVCRNNEGKCCMILRDKGMHLSLLSQYRVSPEAIKMSKWFFENNSPSGSIHTGCCIPKKSHFLIFFFPRNCFESGR